MAHIKTKASLAPLASLDCAATLSEARPDRIRLPPEVGPPSPRLVGVHPNGAGPPHGYPWQRAALLREFEAKRSAVLGI